MGFGRPAESRPHLVAPGKMPPFVGVAGKTFTGHQPVQQPAIGLRLGIGEGEVVRVQRLEAVAMGQRRHIVEQRAHPQHLAALPAQREIDSRAGGMRCG